MGKRRKSKQRDRIYQLIKSSSMHPTAKWILSRMKEEFPSINEGNLYRNIRILVEEGNIEVRDFGDGVEHFDAVTGNHYHFICGNCGRIIDLDVTLDDHVTSEMQKLITHVIEEHTIQFFGVCENCQREGEKL